MENQLHPELAFQAGIPQQQKRYDIHPSLQPEVMEAPEPVEQEVQAVEEIAEQSPVEQVAQQEEAPIAETPKDRDWRAVRQQADEAKALRREAEAMARERDFYRQQAEKQQIQQPQQDDYRTEYEKQLAHEMAQLRQQVAAQEKETAQAKQQSAIARAEQRLAQDYPDIREVVSDDNIRRLEIEYPHLYNSVIASSDVYTVGSAAYEMIMAKGIYKKPSNTLHQLANQVSTKNASKPRSVSTVAPQTGETPIARAGNFMGNSISSEDERKALYAEMLNASRNRI